MKSSLDPIQSLNFLANRVAKLLANEMKIILNKENVNLPMHCMSILADLWKGDGVNQNDLAIAGVKDKATIARSLNLMEQHNVIIRKVDEKDKRNKKIFLTYKGMELQQRIWLASLNINQKAVKELSKEEVETCKKVLQKIYFQLKK